MEGVYPCISHQTVFQVPGRVTCQTRSLLKNQEFDPAGLNLFFLGWVPKKCYSFWLRLEDFSMKMNPGNDCVRDTGQIFGWPNCSFTPKSDGLRQDQGNPSYTFIQVEVA